MDIVTHIITFAIGIGLGFWMGARVMWAHRKKREEHLRNRYDSALDDMELIVNIVRSGTLIGADPDLLAKFKQRTGELKEQLS